jgi:bacterioferritin-associated ferredoxin
MTICDRCGVWDSVDAEVQATAVVTYDEHLQEVILSVGDLCTECRNALVEIIEAWQREKPGRKPIETEG